MDYGNNMWTHPPEWHSPNAVSAIVYYSDTGETGGATAVVPRRGDDDEFYAWPYVHMPGQGGLPFINDRAEAEAMMARESPEWARRRGEAYARCKAPSPAPAAGDVLFYRHDVWHRGTPVNIGKVRYVHNVAWATTASLVDEGMVVWNGGYTQPMYYTWLEKYIATLSPRQLQVVGFPKPSAAMWKPPRGAAAAARYAFAGFSLDAYTAAEDEKGPWKQQTSLGPE